MLFMTKNHKAYLLLEAMVGLFILSLSVMIIVQGIYQQIETIQTKEKYLKEAEELNKQVNEKMNNPDEAKLLTTPGHVIGGDNVENISIKFIQKN